mmetsp:Transcript_10303/g.25280  ORF Transcript_10303/g.25280 Transcript_10303/m.25280 type:complete len:204 (+) Transcript_10303:1430-2041(+)
MRDVLAGGLCWWPQLCTRQSGAGAAARCPSCSAVPTMSPPARRCLHAVRSARTGCSFRPDSSTASGATPRRSLGLLSTVAPTRGADLRRGAATRRAPGDLGTATEAPRGTVVFACRRCSRTKAAESTGPLSSCSRWSPRRPLGSVRCVHHSPFPHAAAQWSAADSIRGRAWSRGESRCPTAPRRRPKGPLGLSATRAYPTSRP